MLSTTLIPALNWAQTPSEGLGHLSLRTVSPGHLLRPNVGYPCTDPLGQHQWMLRSSFTLGNVWLYRKDAYMIDGEWLVADFLLSYGLTDDSRISVGLPVMRRGGGFGDVAIEAFHNALGIGNAHREDHPRNRMRMDVLGPNGEREVIEGDAMGVGDMPVFLSLCLHDPGAAGPAVYVQVGLTLPVGREEELFGLGHPLWGGSLIGFQRLGSSPWYLYGGGSFSYTPLRRWADIELRREEVAGMFGVQYAVSSRMAWMVQYLATSPVARDYYTFADWTHELAVGFKRWITDEVAFEFAFVENIFRFTNSADVSVHAALTLRL